MISFLPYFAACAFVLATKPVTGRWHWIEVSVILLGAFILRALLPQSIPLVRRVSFY